MRRNPYYVCLTLGGAVALFLSVVGAAAPAMTAGVLPLGGTDFLQTAIVVLFFVVVAILADLTDRD